MKQSTGLTIDHSAEIDVNVWHNNTVNAWKKETSHKYWWK